ncbi:MAG TPA: hypothetical protein VGA85_04290 [Dehalococcoidales bacterium]
MNWFERHLNWTAIIITFGGCLFTCVVALLTLGFNLFIPPWQLVQEFNAYLFLLIDIFTCTAISVIGMTWVVRKKKRHPLLTLFFIPSLISPLGLIFLLYDTPYDYPPGSFIFGNLAILVSICIWLLGLVLILFLKNKQVPVQLHNGISDQKSLEENIPAEVKFAKKTPHNHIFLYSIAVLAVVTFTLAGYSCFRMNHGYRVFVHDCHNDEVENLQYSKFTCEIPKGYYEPIPWDVVYYVGEEISLERFRFKLFTISFSSIDINITPFVGKVLLPSESAEDLPASTLIERCIDYYYRHDYGYPIYVSVTIDDLTVTQTSVNGIPAECATFILGYPESDYYYPWDEIKIVCFERKGIIWVIRMENWKDKTVSPNPDFDHLIETFKITD